MGRGRGFREAYRSSGLEVGSENGNAKNGRETSPAPNPTDLGNALRLVARHAGDLRYVPAWGKWLIWEGPRWRVDDTGEVERRAKETVRSIYGEAEGAPDEAARKEIARHAMRSEARGRIEAMIALAQSEEGIPVRVEDLDADPDLLNASNGTLDLRTGELRPHRREDLITKLAPVEYDPDAQAPAWAKFLERVLPGEELRRFVQRAVGYALTGDVSEQVLLFLYGGGANGKSTLINAVLTMLGDYAQQAAPELLTVKGTAHPTELADLFGARFVASVEVEDGRRLAESLVKQLTGGDRIKARFMRQDFFEFDATHKVFLAANHRPVVRGTDHAIWRRIKLVPFEVTIPKEEQDPRLHEKLRAELPGILRWAVEGCLAWQREGLGEPEEVREATAAYRAEQDVLAAFIEECCTTNAGAWSTFKELYAAYQGWCAEAGEVAEKKRRFGSHLTERAFPPDNGAKNVAIRRGIALRSDREPPDGGGGGVNHDRPETGSRGPEAHQVAAAEVNPGAQGLINGSLQNVCKTEEIGSGVNEGYPKSGMNAQKTLHEDLYRNNVKHVNPPELINPGDAPPELAAYLEDPPNWWRVQAAEWVRRGTTGRLLRPLCTATATEVYGSAHRWQEVRPAVEARARNFGAGGAQKTGGLG